MIVPLLAIWVEERAPYPDRMNEMDLDLEDLETQLKGCLFEMLRRFFPLECDVACKRYSAGFMLCSLSTFTLPCRGQRSYGHT